MFVIFFFYYYMQPSQLVTYYFTKHLKFFKHITPYVFTYCFSPEYKRYSLQTNFFRLFYSQPPRKKRRRKYFKYDMYFWTDGAEGFKFKPRILKWGYSRFRFGFIKNSHFYYSAPTTFLCNSYHFNMLDVTIPNTEDTSSSSED